MRRRLGRTKAQSVSTLSTGEFDGDGKADLLFDRSFSAPSQPDDIYIALSRKGAGGRFELLHPTTPWAHKILVGDVDGDGRDDLLVGSNRTVALSDGAGGFIAPSAPPPSHTCHGQPTAADLNGNSLMDLLCVINDGESFTLSNKMAPRMKADPYRWITADISGDGIAELVYIIHLNPGYEVHTIFPATGTRTTYTLYPSSVIPGLDDPDTARFLAIDVGGGPEGAPDGKADLVLVSLRGTTLSVYTLLSNGDGTFRATMDLPWRDTLGNLAGYGSVDLQNWAPADLDGDGRTDLVHTYFLGTGIRVELSGREATALGSRAAAIISSQGTHH